MNYITDTIRKIQAVWKQLTLVGTWLASIAGTFLLPLPSWDSEEQQISKTRFIIFISTVIAGFSLLMTYKLNNKNAWLFTAVLTFVLFIGTFFLYDVKRETNTLPYNGATKVVGNVTRENFEETLKELGLRKDDKELLKYVGGDASKLWTNDSIDRNRNELILYLTLSYCMLAVFMISFINTIIIFTSRDENK